MAEFNGITYIGPARSRWGSYSKRYIVWHNTSNDAAPTGEAAYAMHRTDGVGLHFAVDPDLAIQTLDSWYGTGHVGSSTGNNYGISVELVGFNSWPVDYWRRCIERAAPAVVACMRKHGIPNRWLTIEQMRDGVSKGHVTHDMARLAWGNTDHTDPGPNFPKDAVTAAVEQVLNPPPPQPSPPASPEEDHMAVGMLPEGFAYDENGALIDVACTVQVPLEDVNGTLGRVVLSFSTDHIAAGKEWHIRGASGGNSGGGYLYKGDTGGHFTLKQGQQRDYQWINDGSTWVCFGRRMVSATDTDDSQPIGWSLARYPK